MVLTLYAYVGCYYPLLATGSIVTYVISRFAYTVSANEWVRQWLTLRSTTARVCRPSA